MNKYMLMLTINLCLVPVADVMKATHSTKSIHDAACKGYVTEVQQWLKEGVGVESKDCMNRTPLHLAADFGHKATVEALIEAGADVNAQCLFEWTPLHWAVTSKDRRSVIQLLRDAGANVHAENDDEETPYQMAELWGHAVEYYGLLQYPRAPGER